MDVVSCDTWATLYMILWRYFLGEMVIYVEVCV